MNGMYKIKKKKEPTEHFPTAKMGENAQISAKSGQIGPSIPSAKSGSNVQITATLRSAKKGTSQAQQEAPKKLEAEVELGPTEATEHRKRYIERMSKRK